MTWWHPVALALVLYALTGSIVTRSPLGLLNFLVLQWFGVRLVRQRSMPPGISPGPYRIVGIGEGDARAAVAAASFGFTIGDDINLNPPAHGRWSPYYWHLLRWVWPLTGWWSRYRYIRRPGS